MADEPELRKGQSGEWVQYLQQVLQHAGYWSQNVDGEFGDALEQAVMQFQTANGLQADGVVSAATWAALTGGTPAAGVHDASGGGQGQTGQGQTHDGSASHQGGASEGGESESEQHDPDSVYVDPAYLPITQAIIQANGDVHTYLASLGIDPNALTQEAMA